MQAPLHIGLTGGIGSGKSTVARRLVALGAVLVDTDAIAHTLTAPGGQAIAAIAGEFGPELIAASGAMDRDRMRALVFAEPSAKSRLEGILHPLIGQEAQRQAAAAGTRPVVFDVPLLGASSNWRDRVQRILVVDCLPDTQVRRVMARSGWSEEAVRKVIAAQSSRAARRALADAVLYNEGLDEVALHTQIDALWALWQAHQGARGNSPAMGL